MRNKDPLKEKKGLGLAADIPPVSLADRFGVPPFSVIDARQGYWQARKRQWLKLGIKSELGRGENVLDMSATMVGIKDGEAKEAWNEERRNSPRHKKSKTNVATGGSPEPLSRYNAGMKTTFDPKRKK